MPIQIQLEISAIPIEVTLKKIKNLHLSVSPPGGRVRISAPAWMDLETIRAFAVSRLGWIQAQRAKFQGQARETPREYLERESHFVWGRRCLLHLVETAEAPSVELQANTLVLRIRPGTGTAHKAALLEDWYRRQLRQAVPGLLATWEPRMGVKVERFFVQRMKTRWGTCNPTRRTIRLNTELARKPIECLEYVVVHELAHLLERSHNARFTALLDRFLPNWKQRKAELNRAPLGHMGWED